MIRALQEVQEHAEEAHAAAGAGHGGSLTMEGLPDWISHHIGDDTVLEFAGLHIDLAAFALPPIQLGGVTIDLSPTRQLVVMLGVALLLALLLIPAARRIRARGVERAPSGFANAMEALVLYFRDEVVRPNIGHGADGFTPFILTIFFFVLGMNLIGLTPIGITPTANLSVTAALATVSFLVTEVSGFRALGPAGYARTIFFLPHGLPWILKPVMLVILAPVELLGKLTKPFALAIRLLANMTAGHTLILALMGMIFVTQSYLMGVASVVMASALMGLELFVACLQAYIFAMLTAVFVGLIRHAH